MLPPTVGDICCKRLRRVSKRFCVGTRIVRSIVRQITEGRRARENQGVLVSDTNREGENMGTVGRTPSTRYLETDDCRRVESRVAPVSRSYN